MDQTLNKIKWQKAKERFGPLKWTETQMKEY